MYEPLRSNCVTDGVFNFHGGSVIFPPSPLRATVKARGEKEANPSPRPTAGEPVGLLSLRPPFWRWEGGGTAVLCSGGVDSRGRLPGGAALRMVAVRPCRNKWLRSSPSRRRSCDWRRAAVSGGPLRGGRGGDILRLSGFCPPSSSLHRRVLRRRCGEREVLYRSFSGGCPSLEGWRLLPRMRTDPRPLSSFFLWRWWRNGLRCQGRRPGRCFGT